MVQTAIIMSSRHRYVVTKEVGSHHFKAKTHHERMRSFLEWKTSKTSLCQDGICHTEITLGTSFLPPDSAPPLGTSLRLSHYPPAGYSTPEWPATKYSPVHIVARRSVQGMSHDSQTVGSPTSLTWPRVNHHRPAIVKKSYNSLGLSAL